MKQATTALYLGFVAFALFLGSANADELFSWTMDLNGGFGGHNQFPPFDLSFAIQTDQYYNRTTLFDVKWSTNDVGATLTATPATYNNFDAFAADMTDGISDVLDYTLQSWGAGGEAWQADESGVYFNSKPGSPADLQGNQIDSISLKLNSLSLTPGMVGDPHVIFSYNLTLSAQGHAIPEPSTWSLLALGVGALLGAFAAGAQRETEHGQGGK